MFGLAPTADDLARSLIRLAEQRGSHGWIFDRAASEIRKGDGGSRMHLGNIHLEHQRARPSARKALVEKYLAMMLEAERAVPGLWDLAARAIYPVVRSRYATLSIEIETRNERNAFPSVIRWPWIDDLCVTLVYDHGVHLSQVPEKLVETWGQSQDAVFERAMKNLRALPRPTWEQVRAGVWQVRSEVSYEESFVLVEEALASLELRGPPVVAIPNRGVLLTAGRDDEAGMQALVALAQESMQSAPWSLSGTLLTRSDRQWERFRPPAGLESQCETLDKVSLAITYQEQKAALEKHHAATGADVFVAKFQLWQSSASPPKVTTCASWAEGIVSLLPRTDVIAFAPAPVGKTESMLVKWKDVEYICPHLLQRTNEDPERWRVEGFPNGLEWRALEAVQFTGG